LILKRKLSEKDSLPWIFGLIFLIIISLNPNIFDSIANAIGVDYPPALVFAAAILILLFIIFINTMNISKLKNEIIELTQYIAIIEEKHCEIEAKLNEPRNEEHQNQDKRQKENL
jgi:hypothetical protein